MLNISENNQVRIQSGKYKTVNNLASRPHYKVLNKIIIGMSIIAIIGLFLHGRKIYREAGL